MRVIFAYSVALLTISLIAFSACSSGDDTPSSDASPTATIEATPDDSVRGLAIVAVTEYVETVGIEGETGTFTDPIECPAANVDNANGDFCVAEPGTYGQGLALVLVADPERLRERGWQVRVVFEDEEWVVTEVKSLAAD